MTKTICGNSKPGSKHKYQLAVCSTCIVSSNVRTSSRRPDRIYRTCTDRFIMGWQPWWSWVITSAFVGVLIGMFAKKLNVQEGVFDKTKTAIFAIANVAAHVIGWVVVAPVLDILIYAEPVKKVFAQGVFAAISNSIT